MGVYIKGLDMPRNCVECKLPYEICGYSCKTDIHLRYERHENCTLVEVKEPHGDLIDRDELIEGRVSNDNVRICAKCEPTVIEAEGERRDK